MAPPAWALPLLLLATRSRAEDTDDDATDSIFIDPDSFPDDWYGALQLTQLFLAYCVILYFGCNMISDGAELLMLTPYSKLVGAVILPILGAVPDGAIVLFSGIGPDAQTNLDVGVGALAGSTVMLITIPWFLAIYGGRVDLDSNGQPKYATKKKRLTEGNLWDAGVCTGETGSIVVRNMAYWMAVTSIPYLVIEVGALIAEAENGGILNQQNLDDVTLESEGSPERVYAIVGTLMTIGFFLAYLKYQNDRTSSPSVASKQVRAVQNTVSGGQGLVAAVRPLLEAMEKQEQEMSQTGASQSLIQAESKRSMTMLQNVLRPFFSKYDVDGSGTLETSELGRVFMDLNEPKSAHELEALFKNFDTDQSGEISFVEFCDGVRSYIGKKKANESAAIDRTPSRVEEETKEDGDESEEEECPDEFAQEKFKTIEEQQAAIKRSAAYLCGVGTIVVLIFSDPISDVLTAIGERIGVNAFYVAFVVAPLITNGSELMASYTFAQKKTMKSMTVAYEQLLGAAVMNNTYCLFIFLILIATQGLYWNYTAEVIAILLAELCVFVVATQFKVHTMKTALCVLAIYPATILVVWMLETLAGIS